MDSRRLLPARHNVIPEGSVASLALQYRIRELGSRIALAGELLTRLYGGRSPMTLEIGRHQCITALQMLSADEKAGALAFLSRAIPQTVRLKIVVTMSSQPQQGALFLIPRRWRDENVWFLLAGWRAPRTRWLPAHTRRSARRGLARTCRQQFICGLLYTGGTLQRQRRRTLPDAPWRGSRRYPSTWHDADSIRSSTFWADFTVGRPHRPLPCAAW